ncbi:hypothetical protein OS493_038200 [Desmophyllum pertusum]|uniref:OTU domain-containing protein n=1 Tax=Desmophyllum pertusum TaxID=174260 RepID=A0A9X0CCH7_9CNID|nr:hypothetical protein OS493_038200 [Desmophyllum pertusum]
MDSDKEVTYETNPKKRREFDRRYMKSISKKIKEWHRRTGLPVACFAVNVNEATKPAWIATGMQQLKAFAKDPGVQKALTEHINKPASPSRSTSQTAQDFRDYRVEELRKMCRQAVLSDGRAKPEWKNLKTKPEWWPEEVKYADINTNPKPRQEQLVLIMQRYCEWKTTPPQSNAPQSTPPQSTAPQYTAPQSTPPQSTAPPSTPPQSTPQSTPPQSTAPQSTVPQSTPPQSTAPQSTPPRSTAPHSTPPQSSAPQSTAPESTPPQSTTPTHRIILTLLNEDAAIDAAKATEILHLLKILPLKDIRIIAQDLPVDQPMRVRTFTNTSQERLPERFSKYIPAVVRAMRHEPVFAKGDGNCLFNSVSILMTGKEEDAPIFRLGAALYGAVHFEHILEQITASFESRDDAIMWAATVCTCDLDIFNFCSDAAAIVFKTLEDQIKRTLENFTESGILQISLVAGFLRTPIQQFCNLPGSEIYNKTTLPPCCYQDPGLVTSLKIIWLPFRGVGNNYNHFCPLLPCDL